MSFGTIARGLAGLALIALIVAGIWYGRRQPAEVAELPPPPAAAPAQEAAATPRDHNQRSLEIYEFKRVATSGAERGKEIYYYKCWFCHNDFAEGAPKLTGVYQRGTLMTGRPATDEGIKEIYALARESFRGGNRSFQLQLLPFRMTEGNMALNAASPHAPFWRNLKQGTDIFEATRRPPAWDVCEKRYVFGPTGTVAGPLDPVAACPLGSFSTMAAL